MPNFCQSTSRHNVWLLVRSSLSGDAQRFRALLLVATRLILQEGHFDLGYVVKVEFSEPDLFQ